MKCAVLWVEGKPPNVEARLNEWLTQHPRIDIKAVSQQPNIYTIFYEEK